MTQFNIGKIYIDLPAMHGWRIIASVTVLREQQRDENKGIFHVNAPNIE